MKKEGEEGSERLRERERREGGGERERERETDRQTDRQKTDTQRQKSYKETCRNADIRVENAHLYRKEIKKNWVSILEVHMETGGRPANKLCAGHGPACPQRLRDFPSNGPFLFVTIKERLF